MMALTGIFACSGRNRNRLSDRVGVCTSPSKAALVKEAGGYHVEQNLTDFLAPEKDESVFEKNLESMAPTGIPSYSTNCFFPGDVRIVGPDADHERALRYTEVAMQRAQAAGIKVTVLGSAGSRKIPDGFSPEEAEEQFVSLLKRMGPIAKKYGVTIAIEPLRHQESNFINTVADGCRLARKVNHPNVRVNADIYHMMQEGETPQAILDGGREYICHVHIAENARRTEPGVDGDDFTPYFQALKKIGYRGVISLECSWKDFDTEVKPAIDEVKRQLQSIDF